VFDAGSITKSYTAALVLRLIDEGVLALDDSLARWFPGVAGAAGATIHELLRQTSGLADYARHPGFLPEIRSKMAAPWPPEENLRFVGEPSFSSGARWEYSNTNYLLLGLIAAREAKRPYSRLLREYVLDPLRLTRTFVAGEDTVPQPRAHAFLDFTGDGMPDDLSALVPDPAVTRGAGGAGAVVTTATDVATFARAYYTGAIVADELHSASTNWIERGDGWMYGFGVIAAPYEGDLLLGHLGNTAGQSAGVWHARTAGVTVAILSNVHGVRMAEPVQALLRQALISMRAGG
jgi:D-alanyl-D-alanine carboxypeptidase